jgi:hypothetical protein
MNDELKNFYGGTFLIQQWVKKRKIFQIVHACKYLFLFSSSLILIYLAIAKPNQFFLNTQRFVYTLQGFEEECTWMYVTNFYQKIF